MFLQLLTFLSTIYCLSALQCVDHNNNPVDWYVVYKLPLRESTNSLVAEGSAYTYITSNDESGWKLSSTSINNTNSIVGLTLEPLFRNSPDILYMLYNDEAPDGSIMFKKGHTKGLILSDTNGGVWLIHSVPRFPDRNNGKYYFAHNGYNYGQSFLCISMDLNNLDKVGIQLQYNLPRIYSGNMPQVLKLQLPNLVKVLNDAMVTTAPWYHLGLLKSKAGAMFFSFAKTPKFLKELYLDWVAPTLNSSLLVETWPNGPGRLPSTCGQLFRVYNIKKINMEVANCTFEDTHDHSKWAVVTEDSLTKEWICIGDINRAESQRRRAGGTTCFSSDNVKQSYQNLVNDIQPC